MTAQRTVPAEASQLAVLNRFLQDFQAGVRLSPGWMHSFELALEEIFMNIVMHGAQPGVTARVAVSLELGTDALTMTVEDDGPPFDPLSLPPPDLSATLADRKVGGLGVYLVRKIMDTVTYTRIAGRNQLRMSKRLDG